MQTRAASGYLLALATQKATREHQKKATKPTSNSANSKHHPSNPNAVPQSRKCSAGSLGSSLGPRSMTASYTRGEFSGSG
jgi:hypothetical protein